MSETKKVTKKVSKKVAKKVTEKVEEKKEQFFLGFCTETGKKLYKEI